MKNEATKPSCSDFLEAQGDFHYLAYPAHLLVATLDASGSCDFVSPSWVDFTGRESVQEMGVGWRDRVHPQDQAALERGLQSACQTGDSFRLLFRYQREDGVFRWFVGQGMPRQTSAHGFGGHICLCFDVTTYQDGEVEEERSATQLIALLRQTRLIGVVLDEQGRIQFSNGGLCRLLQCNAVDLIDCNLFEKHLYAEDRPLLPHLYPKGVLSTDFPAEFETRLVAANGDIRRVSWHAMALREFSGRVKNRVLIGDDITELRKDEAQFALGAKIFEATNHAMLITNLQGTIITVNGAFCQLTGYARDEALGNNPRILQSGRHDGAFYQQLWSTLLESGHWAGDIWDRRKDGTIYPKYLSISTIKDEKGKVTHFGGIFYDISERKSVEERLDRLAHYDALTGLPNRCLLLDRLELAIAQTARQGGKLALLFLDLDHFKQVNDALGHAMGDALLKQAAQRMKSCVRVVDTVARMGGDEFVVLLPRILDISDATGVAQKLLDTLIPHYDLEGQSVASTPSIGISIYPDDSSDAEMIIKHADKAMYQAKQAGRSGFRLFQKSPGLAAPQD